MVGELKKLNNYMKDLSYKTIFNEEVSHTEAIIEKLNDGLFNVFMDEFSISEKDFTRCDLILSISKKIINANLDEYASLANDLIQSNRRVNLLIEEIFDDFILNIGVDKISEKKSRFEKLKDNKVALTPDELEIVKDKNAVWSDGSSAVWKSVNSKGKKTFVTHTHRAYNTAPTLKGIVRKFHDFIKSTA